MKRVFIVEIDGDCCGAELYKVVFELDEFIEFFKKNVHHSTLSFCSHNKDGLEFTFTHLSDFYRFD